MFYWSSLKRARFTSFNISSAALLNHVTCKYSLIKYCDNCLFRPTLNTQIKLT
ncbi:hypothetical protein HanXRQr2_Chr03g0087111 [Helianthus annuus]|uniref:Uncharacterized protein n=1 Tax=Helianthus annuus TaxID=4232 RepID=A0A9K3JBJ3_HELAN|nr:hypothetical protein HanXRQr2_Chr03g0087111 [Helianthus annuus]